MSWWTAMGWIRRSRDVLGDSEARIVGCRLPVEHAGCRRLRDTCPTATVLSSGMLGPRRVAFDTCALGNLATDGVTSETFDAALDRHSCRLVSGMSTAQSLLGDSHQVRRQLLALAKLGFDRAPVLLFYRSVLSAERSGTAIGGPWFYNWHFSELFDAASDAVAFATLLADRRAELRNLMRPLPADHGSSLVEWWSALPKDDRGRRKAQLGAPAISELLVGPEGFLTRYILDRQAREGYAGEAFSDVSNHRTSLAVAGLLSLYLLARIMHAEHTPAHSWLKVERDDRNDLGIVAEAAYCDIFVTDDANLLDRLQFLRGRGCIAFEPMSTPAFLGANF